MTNSARRCDRDWWRRRRPGGTKTPAQPHRSRRQSVADTRRGMRKEDQRPGFHAGFDPERGNDPVRRRSRMDGPHTSNVPRVAAGRRGARRLRGCRRPSGNAAEPDHFLRSGSKPAWKRALVFFAHARRVSANALPPGAVRLRGVLVSGGPPTPPPIRSHRRRRICHHVIGPAVGGPNCCAGGCAVGGTRGPRASMVSTCVASPPPTARWNWRSAAARPAIRRVTGHIGQTCYSALPANTR